MKKYVWGKKKKYISEAEFEDTRFLYRIKGRCAIMPFTTKVEDKSTNGYKHSDEELSRYLFTEDEVKDYLPNTYHMFEPVIVKLPIDSLYGEINETGVDHDG